jgi:hypothetical protein
MTVNFEGLHVEYLNARIPLNSLVLLQYTSSLCLVKSHSRSVEPVYACAYDHDTGSTPVTYL